MPKKRKSYWSVYEIGPSPPPLKVDDADADDDADNDGRVSIWKAPLPDGTAELKKSCASDLNNVQTDCWATTTWYKFTFGQCIYTYRQLCWERGNIHCVRPLGRIHTILVLLWKSVLHIITGVMTVRYENSDMLQMSTLSYILSLLDPEYSDSFKVDTWHRFNMVCWKETCLFSPHSDWEERESQCSFATPCVWKTFFIGE